MRFVVFLITTVAFASAGGDLEPYRVDASSRTEYVLKVLEEELYRRTLAWLDLPRKRGAVRSECIPSGLKGQHEKTADLVGGEEFTSQGEDDKS